MKQIRIRYDGGPSHSVRITDAETNRTIDNVRRVEFALDVEQIPCATLEVYMPAVDVVVDAQVRLICPLCDNQTPLQRILELVERTEKAMQGHDGQVGITTQAVYVVNAPEPPRFLP